MDSLPKYFVTLVLTLHGLIHLFGFVKAYEIADIAQLTLSITRSSGILWLVVSILLWITAILLLVGAEYWWLVALTGVVISQYLVFQQWDDARYGTLVNLLILVPVLVGLMMTLPSSFQNIYEKEVAARKQEVLSPDVLTDSQIGHLPEMIQQYLKFSGSIGNQKTVNFHARFNGTMSQSPDGKELSISADQHNFYSGAFSRFFYIESSVFGIPFTGLHRYSDGEAVFQIKVAEVIPVVDAKGHEALISDTVTLFNDMCLFAPSTLVNADIRWTEIGPNQLEGLFRHSGVAVKATLSFRDSGELVSFASDDRYMTEDGKIYENHRWSTPITEYSIIEGRNVPSRAQAVWHLPEGEYQYADFALDGITYNVMK